MTDTLFEMNDKGDVLFLHADMREALKALPENSVDSVVTDPPYHLTPIVKRMSADGAAPVGFGSDGAFVRQSAGFMNKQWDGGDIAYREETWAGIWRVLKPGAYCVAFSSTRGGHHMACAMEQAGFIMHPFIAWVFGTGFPKATRVQSDEWEGWRYGTQSLKPAIEPIYVGQKPFSEKTGTANILRWGTGALNIDGCRVGTEVLPEIKAGQAKLGTFERHDMVTPERVGRWPANVVHDGSAEVIEAFPSSRGQQAAVTGNEPSAKTDTVYGQYAARTHAEPRNDSGSAARFFASFPHTELGEKDSARRLFYSAKASRAERAGSRHPTVKPISLMRWLTRLITPPCGLVLDPFAGSGTTGAAALEEGMRCLLIEREAEYADDIRRRLAITDIGLI